MRTGYIVKTHGELNKNTVGIVVFNYDYLSTPCEVVSYLVPYRATKKHHSNALGKWNVKLKNK